MKNGMRILVMNGCTTTDDLVIISCQYNVNSMKDASANGKESSPNATETGSGYKLFDSIGSTASTSRTGINQLAKLFVYDWCIFCIKIIVDESPSA